MTMMCDAGTRPAENIARSIAAMKMWRRYGSTGTSTPARRPTVRAHGPAALTTMRVAMEPRDVSTAATRRDSTRMPVTSVSRSTIAPAVCAAFANPIVTPFGSAMPSRAQKVAPSTPSTPTPGASRSTSVASSQSTTMPWLRCRSTLRRNVSTLAAEERRNR